MNLPPGCGVGGGARYLVLFHSGPGEKGQRTHNTLDEEYPKLALSVPELKAYSREETMAPSGHQDGPGVQEQPALAPSGSVQFSHSVVSDSWWPHGSQHARPPCPSPTPGVCPNSCPLSR